MEVRLADRRGLLSGPSLSYIQLWALYYAVTMENREKNQRTENFHRQFAAINSPDRYRKLFAEPETVHQFESEAMYADDVDRIEEYLNSLGDMRSLSGDESEQTQGEWI